MVASQSISRKLNRLTALDIKNANTPGFYPDGGGLYLQVSRFGTKNWIYRFTINGVTRDMGFGSINTWSLAEVRERVRESRQLVSQKIDPIQRVRQSRLAEQDRLSRLKTFSWCAAQCHERLKPKWKNAKHAAQWIASLEQYVFPTLGEKNVDAIDIEGIAAVLTPIWLEKRETASRVRGRVREVLGWAAANNYYTDYSITMWEELDKLLPVGRPQKRTHFSSCPHHEVGRLLQSVRDSTLSPLLKLAFEYVVLNAARSSEGRGARKSELAINKRVWIVPDDRMKMGQSHVVPLSEQSIRLLNHASALSGASGLVFPNAETENPYSDQAFTKVILRETLKVPYTTHGFRASFRTWVSNKTTYSAKVAEFALAHNPQTDVEAAYDRTTLFAQRRKLMQAWADYLYSTARDAPDVTEDDEYS